MIPAFKIAASIVIAVGLLAILTAIVGLVIMAGPRIVVIALVIIATVVPITFILSVAVWHTIDPHVNRWLAARRRRSA